MSDFQHSYALVIGINDYSNGISSLKTAVSDATEIAHLLETKHHYTVTLLLDRAATLSQLRQVLEIELPKQIQAGDRFLFYFAGHGIALNGEDGPEGYLVPQNAEFGNVSTYLRMSEVNKALLQLPCRHFLGILDCCFAGAFRWSSTRKAIPVELGTIHKERYDRFIQDPAWQVLTSAAYDQSAWDAFNLKDDRGQKGVHSPFACALIEALEGKADAFPPAEPGKPAGDGVITASELYLYLRDRVEIATEARAIRQTPGIHCLNKHDKGEYIFLTPGHALNLPPAPPLDVSKNPYRGLSPFEEEHCHLFFGRNALTQKLYEFVTSHTLTVVLGASGSGKSSLVKAGLIPKLRQCEDDNTWFILPPFRPGESPFKALNNALASVNRPAICATQQRFAIATPSEATSSGLLTPAESLANWFKEHPKANLLLVVDQFEELITLCRNDQERQQFLEALAGAIATYPHQLHLVLTLRSDFEPQFRNTALEKDWQTARFVVPAMTREELRQAIEEPASARVMYFDPHELVEQLIDEVANMPGALPLLSFALSELYLKYLKRQEDAKNRGETIDRAITQTDYEELGGVTRSLTQRADQEYEALVHKERVYEQTIRRVMLRMVAVGGELARRRVPLSELKYPELENTRVQEIIQRFSVARLLVSGTDTDDNPYVEPAHDALIRGWQKLLIWKKEDQENLTLQRRLTPAAEEWDKKRETRFLWNANPYLEVLQKQVLNSPHNNWLNQVEAEFVQSSLQKRRNNQRRLVVTVTGVILALSGFAIFAGYQWRQAEIGIIEALTQSSKANFTANRNYFDGLIDALSSGKRLQKVPWGSTDQKLQASILTTLVQSVNWVREQNRLQGHEDAVQNVSFSPDGQMLATASYDNTVNLWRRDGSLFKTLKGHTEPIMSVSFSPDAKMIASASQDGTVRLWDSNGNLIRVIPAHKNYMVTSVSFSLDGRIATASDDKTVKLWRLGDGQLLHTLKGHQDRVWQVRFSPKGDRIVTVSDDSTVKLWGQDGTLLKTLDEHSNAVASADFSSDGQFATGSLDGTVKLWSREGQLLKNLESSIQVWSVGVSRDGQTIASGSRDGTIRLWTRDGRLLDTWAGHRGQINSVAFSPDGKTLSTVGNDNNTKLWQVNRNWLTALAGHQNEVNWVTFSPDGKQVASASLDKTVRIWSREAKLPEAKLPLTLEGHNRRVNTVAFSPNGSIIASGSDDYTIKLWGVDGQLQATLKGHQGGVMSLSFSNDGSTIASASADETAKLWSLESKKPIINLKGHKGRVLSVALSRDQQTIATAGDDKTVKLWSSRGQELQTLQGHSGIIRHVGFSLDGTTIVTASDDKTVKLWKRNGELITTLRGHTEAVTRASISPDGRMIASASSDQTIRLWQRDGTLITTLRGHEGMVFAVNFSPDSQWLASGGVDRAVLLWNVSDISFDGLLKKGCSYIRNYWQTQSQRSKTLCD